MRVQNILLLAIIAIGLLTSCQKDQTVTTIVEETTSDFRFLTLQEALDLGMQESDLLTTDITTELDADFSNTIEDRDHVPIIDPCSQGARVFRMDAESWAVGSQVHDNSPRFQLWDPSNTHDGIVMPEYRNQFVLWERNEHLDDAHTILDLDRRTSGRYALSFNLKVMNNHMGYFDLHRTLTAGNADNEVSAKFFYYDDDFAVVCYGRNVFAYEYPQNKWMNITLDIDVDNNLVRYYINNDLILRFPLAYPQYEYNTVAVEAVTYDTDYFQRVHNNPNHDILQVKMKTDNFCFSRVF